MGLFDKLKNALDSVFGDYSQVDDDFYEDLEDALVMSDMGAELSSEIIETVKEKAVKDHVKDPDIVRDLLVETVSSEMMRKDTSPFFSDEKCVILVTGVNGVGKTTTIGKLAAQLKSEGKKVVLGAADTFRAAAVDQLVVWAERAGVDIVKQEMGSDPASVAYDTLKSAVAKDADVVIIDTAGRLHNKVGLMNELTKIRNVMRKVVPDAPHEVLLVIDGSTGQNGFIQAQEFTKATDVTALAVTKLDGTAKGGMAVGVERMLGLPIKFVGLGEKAEDFEKFSPKDFAESLVK